MLGQRVNASPGYYVVDAVGSVAPIGPFATESAARKERRELSIADDCDIVRVDDSGVIDWNDWFDGQ